jgi:LruC domain-containing protein
MRSSLYLLLLIILVLPGCEMQQADNPGANISIKNLVVPENFNYGTVRECELKVVIKDNTGQPLQMIRLDVAIEVDGSRKTIQSIASDGNGQINANLQIPSYIDSIYLTTAYLGLTPEIKIPVINNKAAYNYNAGLNEKSASATLTDPVQIISGTTVIRSLSGFNANGVPDNLEKTNDPIDGSMLNDINASLPERMPVPTYNPEYLSQNNETDIVLNEAAEVWVTFVHEGAGNKNILGYYTYKKGHPPVTKKDIDTIHVIFPNASYLNSGGGLVSGNKAKLGNFAANTVIGWVCIADGYRNNTISAGSFIFYSDPELNPETDPALRQHNVMLYDQARQKVLLGFEDLKRGPGSDDDFNDIVFYVTSNPLTAIDNNNYPKVENTGKDTDGDGITDNFDDYPQDKSKAFNNYYPADGGFATIAFEDLWPAKGDYDMNDITIDYQFNQVTNSSNGIQSVLGKIVLKAMGCSFHNGFGLSWPVSPSQIVLAKGNRLTNGLIDVLPNGLENNPNESVFMVFDDGFKVLHYEGEYGNGVNTNPDAPYVEPDTLSISIEFTAPQTSKIIGNPPYNPFIFINQNRGREVHLPDMAPTSRSDPSFFKTVQDDSDPLQGRYYKTAENLPWAINVAGGFTQVTEKTEITKAYLHFANWAQSGGTSSVNWYLDLPGNRDPEYIYPK